MTKRFSNGLSLLASYAWSKTLTDAKARCSHTFSSDFWHHRSLGSAHARKSYSFEDMPNLASIAYVYDLPVGKGRHFILNRGGVANAPFWAVGRLPGFCRYQSGFPQEIEGNGTTSTLEDNGWQPANRINGVPMASAAYKAGQAHFDPGKGDSMFNPAAFQLNPPTGLFPGP